MKRTKKLLSLALAICMVLSLCTTFAGAVSIADGSKTATIGLAEVHNYLETTAGTRLRGRAFVYTTDDGLSGPAYCIDHGLAWTGDPLPIVGKYGVPATAGAFANGYPQHTVETFLQLNLADNPILAGLTEDEYGYATQLAVWASLGQLAVDGTGFTEGRERLAQPIGDAQQMRVFRAVQLILGTAAWWGGMGHIYETGMYIRVSENAHDGNVAIPPSMTLEFAALENQYGIKQEVIGGKSYYTKEYIVASATSTYYQGYTIDLWATGAPEGTMFTDLSNQELPRNKWHETDTWRTPVTARDLPGINSNDMEFYGKVKLCIPVDTAPPKGEITIHSAALVMQYEIYLAQNPDDTEQSYIIADPSKGTQEADAVLSWGSEDTLYGALEITKVGGGGTPLPGATFTLRGTDGSSRTGKTNDKGIIRWERLDPAITYTLTEDEAPAGYAVVEPVTVKVKAAHTEYLTVRDDPLHTLTVRKSDKQNGYSLQGVTLCFEQIDGNYKTTAVTDHAGLITFNAEKLPLGTYKVYEVATKPGYVLDPTPQTVNWDGKRDIDMTFENVRKPTLIISKKDSYTHHNLPDATFAVYKNGQLMATVTSDDNGLAYATDLTPGYYEVKETVAPAGYTLNTETYGINIDPYDPATTVDPRLVIENDPMPSLRIVKYDRTTLTPMPGTTFKVYRGSTFLGSYTTNAKGEILLPGLEPGTYTAEEQAADNAHIVNSTPQTVELAEGNPETVTLAFYNDLKPGIRLVKVDANDPKTTIAGAVFEIKAVDGSFGPTEYVTDHNGEIDLSDLATGAYVVTELSCPGYTVDSAQRIVQLKANENAEFVFTDSKLPALTLRKQDAAGKAMEGVTYSLTPMGEGAHADERTTNAQGTIVWDGLEPGLYSLREIATLSTHVIDPVEHHVELYPGKDGNLLFVNEEKPSLKITKYDRTSHKAMPGVTFEIWKDTVSLGKYTTNADGEIFLTYIEPGTYKAVEVDTGSDGYILSTTPQEVELVAGGGVRELVFFNDKLPGLRLVKVDAADLAAPIANAKFRFASVKGDYGPVELTTGTDGTIDLSKLPTGAYVVTELSCPGYVVDDAQRIIHLDGNENAQFVFTNTRLPSFKLTKTGADGAPLAGVTYRIAYVKDGTRYMDKTTNDKGEIVLDGLQPGVLSVVETATLPNYILDPTERHVELKAGETATLNLKNDRRPNLTIRKLDADTDEPVAGTTFLVKHADGHSVAEVTTGTDGSVTIHNLLPGVYEVSEKSVPAPYLLDAPAQLVTLRPNADRDVSFRNHQKPGLTVNKVDAITGNPIEGVKFQITYASNNTGTGEINDLGSFVTDQGGQIFLDGLRDGWYKVTELAPKTGYTIKDSAVQECYIPSGTSKILAFENTPLSAIVVWKYDSVFGTAVEGATFQVKYLSGTSGTGGTVIGTYKTSPNGSFTVTGLKAGAYVVEELAPDLDHVIDTAPQTVNITGKDQDVVQLYFGNSPKASLTVKKIDAVSHEPLSDVEFFVTLADGSVVGNANGKYTTDSTGSFTIDGLTPGTTLVVKETRAKAGYLLDDTAQTITVKAGQAAVLEFRNQPLGALVITKLDSETKKPLSGATFRITTSSGQFVAAQSGAVSSNGLFTTDKSGQIVLTWLEPDTYVVTETKAPSGYELDATPQTVKVNAHDTQTLYFYDKPTPLGNLRIVKLDEATRQPISGVEFAVSHMDGRRLGTYRTNSRGIVTLDDLTPGWYTVTETRAAEGYALDAEPRDIQVVDTETATLEITNRLTGSALIHKIDSETGAGIYGVVFLISDSRGNPVLQVTTDQDGYAYLNGELADGRYTIRELQAAEGYIPDTTVKTFYVQYGGCSTITWKNTAVRGQIQVVKRSAEYNSVNGLPAGTLLEGAVFEVYNERTGNKVDTIITGVNGLAASKALPLGRYVIREVKAPANYIVNDAAMTAVLEYSGQIIRFEVADRSANVGVSITKTGPKEAVSGQPVRYVFSGISNTGNITLDSFYWRDTLPAAVTLDKVVTGTYNFPGAYKVVYKVNNTGDYRTLADNLSTAKNYTLTASPAALGLAANERVTEIMYVFGQVPGGFAQVEAPMIYCTAVQYLNPGSSFTNNADVGGIYNGAWVQAVTRWTTTIYGKPVPLPRTGY